MVTILHIHINLIYNIQQYIDIIKFTAFLRVSQRYGQPCFKITRATNPPFLAGRLPVLEAVSLCPYFKRNLPVFENNQFSDKKVIVYENDMRKIVSFYLLTFQAQVEMDR